MALFEGYERRIDKLNEALKGFGIASIEEAKKICNGNPEKNKAWPVDYIDNNKGVQRVTDSQHLDSNYIAVF